MPPMTQCDLVAARRLLGAGLLAVLALGGQPVLAQGVLAPPVAAACATCHGASGEGSPAGIPRLAGQNADYLAHALSMFRARTRASDVMQGVAQGLSEADMRALATYFSVQHPPRVRDQPPAPALVAAGKQLAEAGAAPGVAACFSCHAAGGKGNGVRFPEIAGQPEAFLVARLHEFQARAKQAPPPAGSMTAVSSTLNETQIREAAAYLSTLDP